MHSKSQIGGGARLLFNCEATSLQLGTLSSTVFFKEKVSGVFTDFILCNVSLMLLHRFIIMHSKSLGWNCVASC